MDYYSINLSLHRLTKEIPFSDFSVGLIWLGQDVGTGT